MCFLTGIAHYNPISCVFSLAHVFADDTPFSEREKKKKEEREKQLRCRKSRSKGTEPRAKVVLSKNYELERSRLLRPWSKKGGDDCWANLLL